MEEDDSFLSLKKNLMKIFFFFFFEMNLENLNFLKELKILIDDCYYYYYLKAN